MRQLFVSLGAIVLLSGCGVIRSNEISKMDEVQIQTVSDRELCNPYVASSTAIAERQRRNLGDCSSEHMRCIQMGYSVGTDLYLRCRMDIARIEAQQDAAQRAAWGQLWQTWQAMQQQQPAPPTISTSTCTQMGNTVNCMGTSR